MSFNELKRTAMKESSTHLRFYFILFLPYLLLVAISGLISTGTSDRVTSASTEIANGGNPAEVLSALNLNSALIISTIVSILAGLLLYGASFQLLDIVRGRKQYDRPFERSTAIFGSKLLWGIVGVYVLQSILTVLWMFLFIVPGIVKSIAYSQAAYIYRDAALSGQPISPLAAITQSRQLMNGHKGEYFMLNLSFIGWWLLYYLVAQITGLPLLGIYLFPYLYLTLTSYYVHLKQLN